MNGGNPRHVAVTVDPSAKIAVQVKGNRKRGRKNKGARHGGCLTTHSIGGPCPLQAGGVVEHCMEADLERVTV